VRRRARIEHRRREPGGRYALRRLPPAAHLERGIALWEQVARLRASGESRCPAGSVPALMGPHGLCPASYPPRRRVRTPGHLFVGLLDVTRPSRRGCSREP
jgi:hypothetical protein